MMTTFIELAGGSVEGVETDGLSFVPLLKGNEFAGREWIYSYGNFENNSSKYKDPIGNSDGFYHVISDGEWKFYSDGRLFNISKDRMEQNEISIGYSTENDYVRKKINNKQKQNTKTNKKKSKNKKT